MIEWHPLFIGIAGALATILVAFFGYLGIRATRQTQRESNSDLRWKAMLEKQAEGFTAQIEPLQRAFDALRRQVDELIDERAEDATRFRAAIVHIRALREWIRSPAVDSPPPAIPEQLLDEV